MSALRLEGASFATPDAGDVANVARRPVQVIVPGSQLWGRDRADIRLKDYDQVYEVYKAMPECTDLTWKWWGDLWVWVNTAYSDGRLKIRVTCEDDVHRPVPEDPLKGDCAVVRLGDWKLALVGAAEPFVKVLGRPSGFSADPVGAWTLTFRKAYCKTYDLEIDPAKLGLGEEIPFNVRVYDNDGRGLKCWMEHSPLNEKPTAVIRLVSLSFQATLVSYRVSKRKSMLIRNYTDISSTERVDRTCGILLKCAALSSKRLYDGGRDSLDGRIPFFDRRLQGYVSVVGGWVLSPGRQVPDRLFPSGHRNIR